MSHDAQEYVRNHIAKTNRQTLLFIPNIIWLMSLMFICFIGFRLELYPVAFAYYFTVIQFVSQILLSTHKLVKPKYFKFTITLPLICTVIGYMIIFIIDGVISFL